MRVHLSKLILGLLMSLLVSFNLGLKQFVHSFENHEETVHHCSFKKELNDVGLYFEEQHHHCDYLIELLPAFLTATTIAFSPVADLIFSEQFVIGYKPFHFNTNQNTQLDRGPPQAVYFLI